MSVRSRQEIIDSLMRRAEASGTQDEMKQKIRDVFARVARDVAPHTVEIMEANQWDVDGVSRSVRMLNLIARNDPGLAAAGLEMTFHDSGVPHLPSLPSYLGSILPVPG